MMVKEFFNVVGLLMIWGIFVQKDFIVVEDVLLVMWVKDVGIVVVGKINVLFVFFDWQSYNDIYGIINNFYDFGCMLGGFFGGFLVVLVVGYGLLLIGFDIGGLLCVLVFYCGVYVYKLIFGFFVMCGYMLLFLLLLLFECDFLVIGLMVCSVVDFLLVFDVMVGFDLFDVGIVYWFELLLVWYVVFWDFCVLVIDIDLVLLIDVVVWGMINMLVDNFVKVGVMIEWSSLLLLDFVVLLWFYMCMLLLFFGVSFVFDVYVGVKKVVEVLVESDMSFGVEWLCGIVFSYCDWQVVNVGWVWLCV